MLKGIFRTLVCLGAFGLSTAQAAADAHPGTPDIQRSFSDSSNGGHPHLHFMDPIGEFVTDPPTGSWSTEGEPFVHICVWDGSDCGAEVATFALSNGMNSLYARHDWGFYSARWDTHGVLQSFPLGENEVYRIRIFHSGLYLGHADVILTETEPTGEEEGAMRYLADRTLPIRFRIDEAEYQMSEETRVLSAGGFHTCDIRNVDEAYCWGYGALGELGTGIFPEPIASSFPSPVAVTGGHSFRTIASGDFHTCGIDQLGNAYCWGYNYYGQLGNGETQTGQPLGYAEPQPVLGGISFEQLSPGRFHTCGVATNGDGYCWGYGGYGQLGDGQDTQEQSYASNVPVRVAHDTPFVEIETGHNHSCGIDTSGRALCWGFGEQGQLGDGSFTTYQRNVPQAVIADEWFIDVATRFEHACALARNGKLYCWGKNQFGPLGDGGTQNQNLPTLVPMDQGFTDVSAGFFHTCGRGRMGGTYCWGGNSQGQIGNGSISGAEDPGILVPTLVQGEHTFVELRAGAQHNCGRELSGATYCWGFNLFGQLGTGAVSTGPMGIPTPTLVE